MCRIGKLYQHYFPFNRILDNRVSFVFAFCNPKSAKLHFVPFGGIAS